MADIQVGCCAFNFRGWSLADALGMVRRLGFRVTDVGVASDQQIDQHQAVREPERIGAWIAELAAAEGLTLSELFLPAVQVDGEYVLPSQPDRTACQQMLARFERLCRCAAAANCESIMGVPGRPVPDEEPVVTWDRAAATLRAMVEIAGARGVSLHVEPHAGSLIDQPERALRMAAEVPGLVYTLDYAHFINLGIAQAEVDPLLDHAGHLHAKQARPGSGKVPFHEGTLDVAALAAALRRHDWRGVIAAECMGDPEAELTDYNPAVQSALHGHAMVRALGL